MFYIIYFYLLYIFYTKYLQYSMRIVIFVVSTLHMVIYLVEFGTYEYV